ncbi:hypothetical protein [Azospirillum rugosum]|uniref:Antitoxin VbhA domain-containing protein n=1 Tax=Azospirillum rugosum TaxID=416170 RepID=A0ABS4SUM6_9PROT|nr:hypothetical protein [Azospirillum rugosum]MBP2295793.1 hypothetical protein [Azospirillum rugosum]MDQ0529096.1 hypothetical protein [Azospirillum rugosum]
MAEIKANRGLFVEKVRAARSSASSEVRVNSGVCTPEDVSAIIQNRVTEKADWQPIYQYAAEFD